MRFKQVERLRLFFCLMAVLSLGALVLPQANAATSPLDVWTSRNPLPLIGSHIYGISANTTMAVAVGVNPINLPNTKTATSRLILSKDGGFTWTEKFANIDQNLPYPLRGVAFGNGRWVAVGDSGVKTVSTNGGATWTGSVPSVPTADQSLLAITYGKATEAAQALFIAVGVRGQIFTSPDGATWTRQPQEFTNCDFQSIMLVNGVIVAAGVSSTGQSNIVYSRDGENWDSAYGMTTTDKLRGLAFGDGIVVAVGSSSNGSTAKAYISIAEPTAAPPLFAGQKWSLSSPASESAALQSVCFKNGKFVAVANNGNVWYGNKAIVTDEFGKEKVIVDWTDGKSNVCGTGFGSYSLNAVTWFKNSLIAVGNDSKIFTSPNGTGWVERPSGKANFLYGAASNGSNMVAVGWANKVLVTDDAVTWKEVASKTTSSLFSVAYGNGAYVAVGGLGKVVTSPDGNEWTLKTSNTPLALFGVTHGSNKFVAVGEKGKIITSDTGATWTPRKPATPISDNLYAVTYGASGGFVAVGHGGVIVKSSTGLTWEKVNQNVTTFSLFGVHYAGDTYVAVGDAATILTSPDGQNWTKKTGYTTTGTGYTSYRSVTHDGTKFTAVGTAIGTSDSIIATSGEGNTTSWSTKASGIDYSLLGIAQLNNGAHNLLVAVGAYAGILSSDLSSNPVGPWVIRSTGTTKILKSVASSDVQKRFVAVGETGTILTSTNGVVWDITTIPGVTWFNSVVYGKDRFVAVGTDSALKGKIAVLKDGASAWEVYNWTTAYGVAPSANFYAVTYQPRITGDPTTTADDVGERFVAVGDNGVLAYYPPIPEVVLAGSNLTPEDWQVLYLESIFDMRGITFGNNTYVVLGTFDQSILTCNLMKELAIYWTMRYAPYYPQRPPGKYGFSGVAFGNGKYVAVGPWVRIVVSQNSRTWYQKPLVGYKEAFDFNGITFGENGTFTSVGTLGMILTSSNGEDWTFRKSGTRQDLYGMTYGKAAAGNSYIIVGEDGLILQSGFVK